MGKVNAFDVLKEMGQRNMDIRGFNLYENLAHIQMVGKGKGEHGKITLTIDPKTAQQILNDAMRSDSSLIGMLVIADKKQFEQLKKELENGQGN